MNIADGLRRCLCLRLRMRLWLRLWHGLWLGHVANVAGEAWAGAVAGARLTKDPQSTNTNQTLESA